MKGFSVNSKLYRFIQRFYDILKLNLLWLLFSLPIITIGASTVAAYTVTLKMIEEEEGYIFTQFIKGFKENFKQGIPLGLLALAVPYFVYLNLEFFEKTPGNPIAFLFAAFFVGGFGLFYLTYAFPVCARYQNSFIKLLQNSAAIATQYMFRTLFLWVVIGLLTVLFLFNSTLLLFGLLIGPVSVMFTISGFALLCFKEIE